MVLESIRSDIGMEWNELVGMVILIIEMIGRGNCFVWERECIFHWFFKKCREFAGFFGVKILKKS